ncbi:hypothetical protein TSH64_31185 [Azospirillum sp. TSH64]|nr:hypothetical protein TSH64_31185 [Azospirillum sp. TSH64]
MRETQPRFLRRFLSHADFLHRRRGREAGHSLAPGPGSVRPCFAVLTVLALPMQLDGVTGRLDGRGDAAGSGAGGGCCLLVAGEESGEDGGAGSTLDSWLVVREKPHANNARQVDTVATHTTVLPKSGEAATDWRLMPFVAAQTSGGLPGQPIPLSIVVTSPYGQPNPQYEAITFVLIDNLPDGASLSRGQRSSDGAWKVPQEELSDLTLSLPAETAGPLSLRITAVTDHGGGVVARQAVTLAVPVVQAGVADNSTADPPAQGGSSQGGPAQVVEAAAKPDMAEPAVSGSSSPAAVPEPQEPEPQQGEPAVAEAPANLQADPPVNPPAEAPAAVQPPPDPPAAPVAVTMPVTTATPAPASVAVAAVPAVAAPPPEPPRAEKREEVVHKPAKLPSSIPEAALMKRGDDLFAQGDLAGARLYYEMVAETGNAKAALALGRTHDPLVHERLHVRGLAPDPEQAAAWYRRAVAAGSGDAEQQLKKLTDWLAGKSR